MDFFTLPLAEQYITLNNIKLYSKHIYEQLYNRFMNILQYSIGCNGEPTELIIQIVQTQLGPCAVNCQHPVTLLRCMHSLYQDLITHIYMPYISILLQFGSSKNKLSALVKNAITSPG